MNSEYQTPLPHPDPHIWPMYVCNYNCLFYGGYSVAVDSLFFLLVIHMSVVVEAGIRCKFHSIF